VRRSRLPCRMAGPPPAITNRRSPIRRRPQVSPSLGIRPETRDRFFTPIRSFGVANIGKRRTSMRADYATSDLISKVNADWINTVLVNREFDRASRNDAVAGDLTPQSCPARQIIPLCGPSRCPRPSRARSRTSPLTPLRRLLDVPRSRAGSPNGWLSRSRPWRWLGWESRRHRSCRSRPEPQMHRPDPLRQSAPPSCGLVGCCRKSFTVPQWRPRPYRRRGPGGRPRKIVEKLRCGRVAHPAGSRASTRVANPLGLV
jgi:hypothetical protein